MQADQGAVAPRPVGQGVTGRRQDTFGTRGSTTGDTPR
jgi:hypothetical protein